MDEPGLEECIRRLRFTGQITSYTSDSLCISLYSVAHSSALTFIYQHKKVNIREAMLEKGSEATTRVHSSHRGQILGLDLWDLSRKKRGSKNPCHVPACKPRILWILLVFYSHIDPPKPLGLIYFGANTAKMVCFIQATVVIFFCVCY